MTTTKSANGVQKIGFDDIRVGDTIRVIDIREFTVTEAGLGEGVRGEGGVGVLREPFLADTTRKFHLVNRPVPAIEERIGAVVKIGSAVFLCVQSLNGFAWSSSNGVRLSTKGVQVRADKFGGFEQIL